MQLSSPRASGAFLVALSSLSMVATGCSSSSKGSESCTDGGCEARAVFATGSLGSTLVTSDAVYVSEKMTCSIYAADKPVRTTRLLARDACNVSAFARTPRGLFWTSTSMTSTTSPRDPGAAPPKGALLLFAEADIRPTVIDAELDKVGAMAVVNENIYVGVADGLLRLAPESTKLERVLTMKKPYALRAYGGALYWHDGLSTIFTWRPGDAKPTSLVENADVVELFGGPTDYVHRDEPFAVDASGIYWLKETLLPGGTLNHAPLAGGKAEKLLDVKDVPEALALDDDAVYWTEADSGFLPQKTTIKRAPKNALGTFAVISTVAGDAHALQAMPEGLYIAADPSLTDLDVDKIGFKRYAGPLLFLPRGVLGDRR